MMRVLFVARYKENGFAPFVTEQVNALKELGVECRLFPVQGKGVVGYIRHLPALRKAIGEFHPDVIHAHYGLCGLLANLQKMAPVVTTYHGSDINDPQVRRLSRVAIKLSHKNIFVSQKLMDLVAPVKNGVVIPCGINVSACPIVDKVDARNQMGLEQDGKYVLFAGAFDNPVKNAGLAQKVVNKLPGVNLLELKGYTRPQVAMLMQAVDAFLMTSISEGSPQVIKEALACGCPIVSVDVGDVRERIAGVEGCYVSDSSDPSDVGVLLNYALSFKGRTLGRNRLLSEGLDNVVLSKKLIRIYETLNNA